MMSRNSRALYNPHTRGAITRFHPHMSRTTLITPPSSVLALPLPTLHTLRRVLASSSTRVMQSRVHHERGRAAVIRMLPDATLEGRRAHETHSGIARARSEREIGTD